MRAGLLALALLGSGTPAQSPGQLEGEIREAAKGVIPATVRIRVEGAPPAILGSTGVIVDPRGLVVSDADATLSEFKPGPAGRQPEKVHTDRATVFLPPPDSRQFPARLLKRDGETDLALLQMEVPPSTRLPSVTLAGPEAPGLGLPLLVAGNAFGTAREGTPAVSYGILSAWRPPGKDGNPPERFYTNAPVNPGNNGGPVVDLGGNLAGIVSTFESDPASPWRGLGLVTPLAVLARVFQELPEGALLFGDRRRPPRRTPKLAGLLAEGHAWLAAQAAPAVARLVLDRGGIQQVVTTRIPDPRTGKPVEIRIPTYGGPGTALCVDPEGLLLAPLAALWQPERIKAITVQLADGRELPAALVARDHVRQLALLKVEPGAAPLPVLEMAPEEPEPGALILAVSRPGPPEAREKGLAVTSGLVSALHQGNPGLDALQVDAGLNDALAGGAVIDVRGRLLGLGILLQPDRTGRNSGINFAVPTGALREGLARLKGGKDVERGWMGISLAESASGEIVVSGVAEGGPAAKAGLAKDDEILALAGRKAAELGRSALLIAYLQGFAAGDEVEIEIRRDGKPRRLKVSLEKQPPPASAPRR